MALKPGTAAARNAAWLEAKQRDFAAAPQPAPPRNQTITIPAVTGDVTAADVPVDEMGQNLLPARRPVIGPMFTPRIIDRRRQIQSPWTAEKIIRAMEAADYGDMGPQSELIEHMQDRDGAYLAFRQTRIGAPSKLPWTVEPADDSDLAKAIADFVRAEIKAVSNFDLSKRDTFGAVETGVDASWLDWREGGRAHGGEKPLSKYRIEGIHHINPKRYRFHWMLEKFLILPDWAFGKAGELGLMTGYNGAPSYERFMGAGLGVEPPPWKVLIHRSRTKPGHPAKSAVARVCALDFFIRANVVQDTFIYCDRYGMPMRIAKYPPGMRDEEKEELAQQMERLTSDAAAIVSNLVTFEFLESRNRTGGTMPYFELMKYSERNMQLAWLGQDQTSTHNDAGGRTQVEFGGAPIRQDLLEADCLDAQITYTMQLCYPLVGFSDFEKPVTTKDATGQDVTKWPVAEALCPKFKIKYEPEEDQTAKAETAKAIFIDLKVPTTPTLLAKFLKVDLPPLDVLQKADINPDEVIDYSAVKAVVPPGPTADRTAPTVPPAAEPKPPGKKPAPASAPKPPVKPVTNHAAMNFAAEMADHTRWLVHFHGGAAELSAAEMESAYEFASVQVNITGAVATQCLDLAASIPDDALAEKGREDTPRVTAKFGIDPSVTIEELRAAIGDKAAGSLKLGSTAFFALPDYDVVFLTVESPDLVALNKAIVAGVKTTDTQPNYVPHLTLAYVVSGRGHEFAGNGSLSGVVFEYRSVYYSDMDGKLTRIQAVRGHVRVTPPKAQAETFFEPKFYHGEEVPDGWPDDFFAASSKATYLTLSHMIAAEPDGEKRVAMERDREMIRRDCWAMAAKYGGGATAAPPSQAALDELTAKSVARADELFGSLTDEVRAIIARAGSLEEIPKLLRESFATLDTSQLDRLIRRAVFVARLHGRSTMARMPPAK